MVNVLPMGASILKRPSASLTTDLLVPFTTTVAPESGSPEGERKVPETTCCAHTLKLINKAAPVLMAKMRNRFLVIMICSLVKKKLHCSMGNVWLHKYWSGGLLPALKQYDSNR